MKELNSYYAFISYNSADEIWAKWLQHNLEYYHIPSALCKEYPELPKKIRPVFWYKQDLSGTKLKKALNNELSSSKYLIVICSPDSAKADWVNDEVVAFIEQGKGDRIIPFIVAGTPHAKNPEEECFPPALRNLTRDEEIRGIDVRRKEGKSHALVDVIATMFGVRFDVLWQRHERRRKKIRNAWISFIFIFLSILGLIYFRMCPQYIYYSDIVNCNGFPCGVETIDKSDLRNRHVSYKFVMRRNNLFDTNKKLIRVERVNSYDLPTNDCPSIDYLYPIDGYIKNQYPILYIKDNGIIFCNKEYVKKVAWEYTTMRTSEGSLLIADIKRINDLNEREVGDFAYIFERNTKSKVNRYCYELDDNGYAIKITYHAHSSANLDESNCTDNWGSLGYTLERDSLHRIIKVTTIGSSNDNDVHLIKLIYSNIANNYTSIRVFDNDSIPMESSILGGVHCISSYTINGNSVETNSYDAEMNLANNINGYAKQTVEYFNGCPVEITNYDESGERTNDKQTKCSKCIFVYDNKGRKIKETYYDVSDNICLNHDGWAIIEYEYNSNHNIIRRSVYDERHNPTLSKTSNYATLLQNYNERGDIIYSECLDVDGKRCNNKEGFCIIRTEYDRLGNVSCLEYFNDTGDPTFSIGEGYAKYTFDIVNDRTGNTIATLSFYGIDGEPIFHKPSMAHKHIFTYGLNGNLINMSFYGIDNKKCLNSLGFASMHCKYDKKGRLVTRTFLDCADRMTPLLSKFDFSESALIQNQQIIGGYAKDSIVYISDKQKLIYKFNENNKPSDSEFIPAIESVETKGDTIVRSFFDSRFRRTSNYDGSAICVIINNSFNNPIEGIYLNEDSVLFHRLNTPKFRFFYNKRGNLSEQHFLDKNNFHANLNNKFACIRYEYDNRDNQIACLTFDLNGKPAQSMEQGFGNLKRYDSRDRLIETEVIDTTYNAYEVFNRTYAYERLKYDERGNVIECSYFDEDEKPVRFGLDGPHMIKCCYDKYNNCIEKRYYDTDNSAMMMYNRYHYQQNKYKNLTPFEISYYDIHDNCVNVMKPFYDSYYNMNYVIDKTGSKLYNRPCFKVDDDFYILLKWRNWNISEPANNYLQSLYTLFRYNNEEVVAFNTNTKQTEKVNLHENTLLTTDLIPVDIYAMLLMELERL